MDNNNFGYTPYTPQEPTAPQPAPDYAQPEAPVQEDVSSAPEAAPYASPDAVSYASPDAAPSQAEPSYSSLINS
ncbi:MAG: hypothetical protein IJC18_03275, partial [Clostridia bacterium]|nr:hypothetical protein [Clostridia bacterium]